MRAVWSAQVQAWGPEQGSERVQVPGQLLQVLALWELSVRELVLPARMRQRSCPQSHYSCTNLSSDLCSCLF